MLVASGPFKLGGIRTDDGRVSVNREVLRDDHRTVSYLEAEVGDFIELRLHMAQGDHPSLVS